MWCYVYRRSSTQCIAISDVIASNLLHTNCTRFIRDRCYLHTNNITDFNYITHTIDIVVDVIEYVANSGNQRVKHEKCGDILLGVVCNSLYLGCNPVINLPITLCRNTCLEYSKEPSCLPFLATVFNVLNERTEDNVDVNLDSYLSCNISNSFHDKDVNESTNTSHSCYEGNNIINISHAY